ncbi:MAG: NAD(P)H-hydrate epimerase [Oscillospiraceae bacterium]
MKILTSLQMKQAEAAAVARGTSYGQLMENAGAAAADFLRQLARQKVLAHRVLLLCGRGNNAGDAFVMARLLAASGWQAELLLLCGTSFSELAGQNFKRLPPEARVCSPAAANFAAPFLVDGVFGTGFHGSLPAGVLPAFEKANAAGGARIALDVPSGLNCDTGEACEGSFSALHTLTFGAYKPALVMPGCAGLCGQVHCLQIGL